MRRLAARESRGCGPKISHSFSIGKRTGGYPKTAIACSARRSLCICEKLAKDFWRVFLSGCMLPLLNGWLRRGLSMRHKPRLDGYTAGIIGLGLLPIAMAFAAVLIP